MLLLRNYYINVNFKKMKKVLFVAATCLLLTSCYSSKVTHGNVSKNAPAVKINSKKNHFLFWGLVPLSSSQKAEDYVEDMPNYVVQTSWTFVDGLLGTITYGIYTPTTTTYYVPLSDLRRQ